MRRAQVPLIEAGLSTAAPGLCQSKTLRFWRLKTRQARMISTRPQPAGPRPSHPGEVAEWLNAPHSKCGIRATVSGVRSRSLKLQNFDLTYPPPNIGFLLPISGQPFSDGRSLDVKEEPSSRPSLASILHTARVRLWRNRQVRVRSIGLVEPTRSARRTWRYDPEGAISRLSDVALLPLGSLPAMATGVLTSPSHLVHFSNMFISLDIWNQENVILALAALAQPTRPRRIPPLVKHEPDGLPAATPSSSPPPHLLPGIFGSFRAPEPLDHLPRRPRPPPRGRDLPAQDCCGGQPEVCAPLIDALTPCCPPKEKADG